MRIKMVCAVLVNNCLFFCILLGLDSKEKLNLLKKNSSQIKWSKIEIGAVHSITHHFLVPVLCPFSTPCQIITPLLKSLSDCLILTPPPHLTINLPILVYITHSVYFHNQWIQLNWMLNKQYIIIFNKYTFKLNMFSLMATTKNKT